MEIWFIKSIKSLENFSALFKIIVNRFRNVGYYFNIVRQTACLVLNPVMVDIYAALFSYMVVVQVSDSMTTRLKCVSSWLRLDN